MQVQVLLKVTQTQDPYQGSNYEMCSFVGRGEIEFAPGVTLEVFKMKVLCFSGGRTKKQYDIVTELQPGDEVQATLDLDWDVVRGTRDTGLTWQLRDIEVVSEVAAVGR